MKNLFWGATQQLPGATYLNSRSILNVKEGYNTGTTTEYVDIGDFEVNQFTNKGSASQEIAITASSPIVNLSQSHDFTNRSFKNAISFYDDFKNPSTLDLNYSVQGSYWTMASNTLIATNPMLSYLTLNESDGIEDFSMVVQFANNKWSNTTQFQIAFRMDNSAGNWYYLQIIGTSNLMRLRRVDGRATDTLLQGVSFTPVDNTRYWLMLVVRQNRIFVYVSTDGRDFTNYIDYTIAFGETRYDKGTIALVPDMISANSNAIYTFYSIDLTEVGNRYTNEDIATTSLGMGGVFDKSYQNTLSDISTFQSSTGSSWVVTGNQVDLTSTTAGASWHTYFSPGASFIDVVFEAEVRGTSGNYAGLMYGLSDNWYGNYLYFGQNSTSNSDVEHWLGNRFAYTKRGAYLKLQPEYWYKVRLVKEGARINWYVNGQLSNSIVGLSLPSATQLSSNRVGLFSYRAGVSGTLTRFRNLRKSVLSSPVEDVNIEAGTNAEAALERYLPKGVAVNWGDNVAKIFATGSSRANHGISNNSRVYEINENINNDAGNNLTIIRGNDFTSSQNATNPRVRNQVDKGKFDFINDPNVKSVTDGKSYVVSKEKYESFDIQPLSVSIPTRVEIERFDQINVVNTDMGISGNYLVGSFDKTLRPEQGEFTQDLSLVKDNN